MNIISKVFTKDELIAEIERVKKLKPDTCIPCAEKKKKYLKELEDQLWEKYIKGASHEIK